MAKPVLGRYRVVNKTRQVDRGAQGDVPSGRSATREDGPRRREISERQGRQTHSGNCLVQPEEKRSSHSASTAKRGRPRWRYSSLENAVFACNVRVRIRRDQTHGCSICRPSRFLYDKDSKLSEANRIHLGIFIQSENFLGRCCILSKDIPGNEHLHPQRIGCVESNASSNI